MEKWQCIALGGKPYRTFLHALSRRLAAAEGSGPPSYFSRNTLVRVAYPQLFLAHCIIAHYFAHSRGGWRPLRAAALPAISRAIHWRASRIPSYFSRLCKHESQLYKLSYSCMADLISPYENVHFFRLPKKTFPTLQKNFPLNPELTFETRKITFEVV